MNYYKHKLCLALDWLWWHCDMGTRRERVLEHILGWLGWWSSDDNASETKVDVELADL